MKFQYLLLLLALCFNTSWADFSNTGVLFHPFLPSDNPYLIEMTGEWPTDCHPGEQNPVITEYTGDSVLIEFETIVENVTCNEVVTPYRVLVDMSDVIGSVEGNFYQIEITVRFGEAEYKNTRLLRCGLCSPVPVGPSINPEAGLYYSDGLEKQGLLLARQNQRMGAYPLIYDEAGSSEWVFGGGGIVEDVYFVDLYELTGGQCLGCPPPDEPPQMDIVGKLSMLMDSEGVIQVKVNDGLFETYEPLVFGYGELKIGGSPRVSVADLSGRWAFSESDIGPNPNGSFPPIDVLSLVFDIVLESVDFHMPPITLEPPTPPGDVTYSIRDIDGEEIARMKCTNFIWEPTLNYYEQLKWTCIIPETESESEIGLDNQLFRAELLSPERLLITYAGPVLGVGTPSDGIAVRID